MERCCEGSGSVASHAEEVFSGQSFLCDSEVVVGCPKPFILTDNNTQAASMISKREYTKLNEIEHCIM